MKGIVNKPQFDLNIYAVGVPVYVSKYEHNNYNSDNFYALILESNPLQIRLMFIDEGEDNYKTIKIEQVTPAIGERYEINFLKIEKE